jgi:hypothetical protein
MWGRAHTRTAFSLAMLVLFYFQIQLNTRIFNMEGRRTSSRRQAIQADNESKGNFNQKILINYQINFFY